MWSSEAPVGERQAQVAQLQGELKLDAPMRTLVQVYCFRTSWP
jgi:hypothetical protein